MEAKEDIAYHVKSGERKLRSQGSMAEGPFNGIVTFKRPL